MNKIFVIGLPRTGTTSLNKALGILDYKSKHNPTIYRNLQFKGVYEFPDEWDSLTNFGEHTYPQLDKSYPNSKFILTIRDKDKWLESIGWRLKSACEEEKGRRNRIEIFGAYIYNKERFNYVYDLHQKNAIEYFKNRPNDFLIMYLDKGDGWEKLCPFLEKDIPKKLFPHTHSKKEMIEERKNRKENKETLWKKIKTILK